MAGLLVLTTAPDAKSARRLVLAILRKKLAACVSVREGWQSAYRWKGRIEHSREHLLLIKTVSARYAALEREIRAQHPYEVPEVLALPVQKGSKPYLQWLNQSVSSD